MADLGVDLPADLPNLNSSWPLDVSTGGRSRGRSAKFELILTTSSHYGKIDLVADLGVDLPNLNSSWPLDVSTWGVDLPNLNSSWPLDVSTEGGRPGGRSRGRSAKFELILTTRCQYWRVVDLLADLRVDLPYLYSSRPLDVSTRRVDLPNLNSSWPLVCQYWEGRSGGRSKGRSAKIVLILTTRCQYQRG